MHRLLTAALSAALLLLSAPIPAHAADGVPALPSQQLAQACCKHCSKGKPCGDSCISRDRTCEKGPGCACHGDGSPQRDLDAVLAPHTAPLPRSLPPG